MGNGSSFNPLKAPDIESQKFKEHDGISTNKNLLHHNLSKAKSVMEDANGKPIEQEDDERLFGPRNLVLPD